eukprot:8054272-Pyramimonas_sp.AAC.1
MSVPDDLGSTLCGDHRKAFIACKGRGCIEHTSDGGAILAHDRGHQPPCIQLLPVKRREPR